MDKQALKQYLTEIAEYEVSDDMNLLPEIRTALAQANPPKPKRVLRLANIAAATAIIAFSAVAVYAVYQELRGGDPGLEAVNADNQIVYFDETQAIEGGEEYDLEVTLDYAYADANRITVAFTVNGQASASEVFAHSSSPTLTDDNGNQYVWLPVGGGGGGGGGSSNPDEIIQYSTNMTANFDASLLNDPPEELNLHLVVDVAYTHADNPQMTPETLPAGSATFDFTLPFNPGRVMNTPQTVEAETLDITLQKVVVAPSLTRIELCYQTVPEGASWIPYGSLEIGGETVVEGQFVLAEIGVPVEESNPCHAIIIPDALQDAQGEWVLTIEAFTQPNSANPEDVVRLMQERYGVEVTAHPGGGFSGGFSYDTNAAMPEGITVDAAFDEIMRELQHNIEGPWVFTFTVP